MSRWRAADLALTLVTGVIFGLLYLAWGVVWNAFAFANTIAPGLQNLFYGFWLIAAIFAPATIRRPAAALIAHPLAVLVEMLVGGDLSSVLLLGGLAQALAAELTFALAGDKRYDLPVLMGAGGLAGAVSLGFDRFVRYPDLTTATLALTFATRSISGALLAGWLGSALANLAVRLRAS